VKLPRAVFRYIEHELYNYDATKKAIEELREDIILSSPPREVVAANGDRYYGDTVGTKTVKLVTSTALARMSRAVVAIERTLARLTEDHRQLFELKYRQCLPWQQVCRDMPTSERTYFRLRRELVEMVALEFGLAESWQE